jgi:Flp pilus assembly pilin Flp
MFERMQIAIGRLLTVRVEDLRRENGQGAVEYALVVLGVAAIIAAAVAGFTNEITSFMKAAGTKLKSYVPA